MRKTTSGFTIVELLIVIVVIAILAAISVVAYSGIQDRTRKSYLMSDSSAIKKAMEMFKADQGMYPLCPIVTPPTQPSECGFNSGPSNNIREQLSQYASGLSEYNFNYVRPPSEETRWGMRYRSSSAPYNITLANNCKFGVNMYSTWYSSAPECVW